MIQTVLPGFRSGAVDIPASKSRAHRLLICAALGRKETVLRCSGVSRDIQATVDCLNAMGARIVPEGDRIRVRPLGGRDRKDSGKQEEEYRTLPCGESGSTLRFLLPVAGALGMNAVFQMEGRLPERPLQPLQDLLCRHGMSIRREKGSLICSGGLTAGDYRIPGNVSSQYVSGLLFALPLLSGESRLTVEEPVESAGYISMTEDALALFGYRCEKQGWSYRLSPRERGREGPDFCEVESDWSSAAFFLVLGALGGKGVTVRGMNLKSRQGDRKILDLLRAFGANVTEGENGITAGPGKLRGIRIDASPIPDLVPVLSVAAALAEGETRIEHAERLRLKESDRLAATTAFLSGLGADITEMPDGLLIRGRRALRGGAADSAGDHRIAMSAAVAAAGSETPVTISGAECTDKSFPGFWDIFENLKRGDEEK